MNSAVIEIGYVGLVCGPCLAEICTWPDEYGSTDFQSVLAAARSIHRLVSEFKVLNTRDQHA